MSVPASWTVPLAWPRDSDSGDGEWWSTMWVGLDGVDLAVNDSGYIIQAGTFSKAFRNDGVSRPHDRISQLEQDALIQLLGGHT